VSLLHDGYELINSFLSSDQLFDFNSEFGSVDLPQSVGGIRNAQAKYASIGYFSSSECMLEHASRYLSGAPEFVRAILFNKTESNNWLVSWHQDRTVAVSGMFSADGWGPWSEKDGVIHVQPPIEVLNSMVTFRVHLDACSEKNGCLSVVPKSHMLGILTQRQISEQSKYFDSVSCPGPEGSALVMRPHLLHASSKGAVPSQRRVLHLEYSDYELPANDV